MFGPRGFFIFFITLFLGAQLQAGDEKASWDPTELKLKTCYENRPFTMAGSVTRIIAHPDNKRVLSSSRDGSVRVWNIETGEEISRYEDASGAVWGLAILPDGKRAMSGSGKASTLWEIETGKIIREFKSTDSVYDIALRPGTTQFAAAEGDKLIGLWDYETGKKLQTLKGHKKSIYTLRFHAKNQLVSGEASTGSILLWDFPEDTSKPPVSEIYRVGRGDVYSIAPHPSEALSAVCFEDEILRVIDGKGVAKWSLQHIDDPKTAAWAKDGKRLLSISDEKRVRLWQEEKEVWNRKLPNGSTWAVAWAADEKAVFASVGNQLLKLDPETGKVIPFSKDKPLRGPVDPTDLIYSKTKPNQLLIPNEGGLHRFDIALGKYDQIQFEDTEIEVMAISPSQNRIAISDEDNMVRILDVAGGREVAQCPTEQFGGADSVCFLSEDQLALTAGSLRIYTFQTGDEEPTVLAELDENSHDSIVGLVSMAHGLKLLTEVYNFNDESNGLVIRNASNGAELQRIELGEESSFIQINPSDGQSIIAYVDGTLSYWPAPKAEKNLAAEDIDSLISQLGADSVRQRKAAVTGLIHGGMLAVEKLQEALKVDDPEVRFRAEQAISKLAKLGKITADPITIAFPNGCNDICFHPDGVHWFAVSGGGIKTVVKVGKIQDDKMTILHELDDGHGAAKVQCDATGKNIYVINLDGSLSHWAMP